MEQYKRNRQQARDTLNRSDLPPLIRAADRLKEEYEELSREIDRLRTGALPELTPLFLSRLTAELRSEWEAQLHWLDYDKPENRLHKLIRVQQQTAVLLFIQHRIRMKADLYIRRIHRRVFDQKGLRPFTEDFSNEGRVDPYRFIERWRAILQIQAATPGLEAEVQQVVQALQQTVTQGQTLCIEIRVAEVSDDFLGWFLEAFWRPLVDAVVLPNRGINLFVVLTTEQALPKGLMLPEWCCKGARFEREKYFEMRLQKWRASDIEVWVIKYLNASLDKRSLPLQDAPTLANRVYTYSDKGMPLHAHNYILGDILTQVVAKLPGQHHATS
jgi:hypothetical protein